MGNQRKKEGGTMGGGGGGGQGRHGHDRRGPRPPPSRPLRTVTDRYGRYKHASLHKNAGAALD